MDGRASAERDNGRALAIIYLTEGAIKAAGREGIPSEEISEEVGSLFEVILQAMQHREGGLVE
ncbi:MAG: DUF768 domain-containing protein [Mesorhizobium sp.]|nr:MAG: DUF768 domain-containing protein [Mesorhizobium sp.]